MRSNMIGKPLDYPREFFEVHCTTAEKLFFSHEAKKAGFKNASDWIKSKLLKGSFVTTTHVNEKSRIDFWTKELANLPEPKQPKNTVASSQPATKPTAVKSSKAPKFKAAVKALKTEMASKKSTKP